MAAITLDIGGNTRQLDRDIQKTVNKVYTINLKTKGDQPLGRITGQVNEFNKSLDASNARVIAFGASAGIIFGVERAFGALVQATIEVQKSLQDINVILNASQANLQKFGAELFNIARNTGQSFQEVAKAATEFSRQGLGIEETLKRTNEALILSRLSGLDAAKSVESLTAAVNSFASQAVTATEVVNKFATVDAAFAVSSADLADAIARVGSSAAQSGVSLNELIAIVTSAQQTTARGGAVIGNSFKTIFTRLQREKVVDLLESLGISGTDSSGQVKSTIQLLQDLGAVYDTLGSQQQAYVAEQVGGVFQINILKAALADLGKEYSIYSSALNVAAGATDQAIRRNEELNKTYAAQINALAENARQLAAAGGERLLGPSIDRLVGGTNTLLEGFSESDGQGVGAVLGKGILDGIGQFIAGPGLALIGGVLLKLFRDLAKFATGSVQQLLGLNTAATQQRDLQQSINQILTKNPQLLELALKGSQGLNQAANSLLASLQKQTVELQKQAQVAQQISKAFVAQAGVRVAGGVPVVPTPKPGRTGKAAGYIPNFAKDDFAREELLATALGARNPTAQLSKGTIDGRRFIKNNREVEITNFGKNGDSAVIPSYAKGFIPNFAKIPSGTPIDDAIKLYNQGLIKRSVLSSAYGKTEVDKRLGVVSIGGKPVKQSDKNDARQVTNVETLLKQEGIDRLPTILSPTDSGSSPRTRKNLFPDGSPGFFNFQAYRVNTKDPSLNDEFEQTVGKSNFIDKFIEQNLIPFAQRIAAVVQSPPIDPDKFSEIKGAKGFKSSIEGALGGIFDAAITTAIGVAGNEGDGGDFDVRLSKGGQQRKYVNALFGPNSLGGRGNALGDFKKNAGPEAANSMIDKTLKEYGVIIQSAYKERNVAQKTTQKIKAAGYIPNFAAIQDAVARERAAGIPSSQIYLAQEKALTSANPMGLGVFNKRDEPTAGKRREQMRRKGFASGYVPNFAIEDPDVQAADTTSALGALAAQATTLAFAFQFSRQDYKQALDSFKQETGKAAGGLKKFGIGLQSNALAISIAAPILAETIKNVVGQETAGARQTGAVASGVGQIASFAATGGLLAKGPGAAIGTAIGAILTIPSIINEFNAEFPELAKAAKKSSEDLTKFNDITQRLNVTTENLNNAYKSNDPGAIAKAEEQYQSILSELSVQDQERLKGKTGVEFETELGKLDVEKRRKAELEEINALVSKQADISTSIGANQLIDRSGSKERELTKSAFVKNLLQGKTGVAAEEEFAKRQQQVFDLINIPKGDTESLRKALEEIIPEYEGRTDYINQVIREATAGTATWGLKIGALSEGFIEANNQTKNGNKLAKERSQAEKETAAAQKQAQTAINATIESIQKNIAIQNLWRSAIDNLGENIKAFSENLRIEQELTQPRQVLENIIGADKTPVRSLAAQEGIAGIQESQRSALAGSAIGFKENVRGILEKPFQENLDNIVKKLGESSGALQGKPKDIIKQSDQYQSEANQQFSLLNQAISQVEGYMAEFVSGQISTQQLLEQSRTALSGVGIDVSRGTQASNDIEKAVAELEVKTLQEQVKAFQQRAKLASETKQAILQDKINQAIGTFGGFEGFMNRPEEEQNYIQRIAPDLEKIGEIRSSLPFTYNNRESVEARKQQAPALGRSFANVYRELINQSGGAFRGFIQQGLRNRQLTSGQGGRTGKFGGFDDIIAGRQVDLEQQLKLAEDQLKITTDETLKRDLQGFIDSVKNMPGGLEGIATLQTQKEFGVARQSDFQKLFKQYDVAAFDALSEISPELAASLASATAFTDDPLLNEASAQTAVQTEILKTIQKAMSGQAIGTTGMVEPFDIEAYNKEKDPVKRAAMKAGYGGITPVDMGSTTGEAVKNQIKAIQDKVLPTTPKPAVTEPQKTISQIEAETRAKRNQKLGAQPQTGIYTGGYIDGMRENEATFDPERQKAKNEFEQWRSKEAQRQAAADAELQKALAEKEAYDAPARAEFEQFRQSQQIVGPMNEYALEEDRIRREMIAREKMISEGSPLLSQVQNQPAAAAQQSFTQQEAAFSNNTSALTTLAGGIESLNSTLSNFESNFANLNNIPGGQQAPNAQQGSAQPNIQTTTSAPVSVIVNAQGSNDIATAVGEAIKNAIPEIVNRVRAANGEKIPPTSNPKFGAGQRADGGFLL